MLVSYKLLKKYVELPKKITPQEVAEKLTMATVEVERVIDKAQELKNIVVGRVERIEEHPNADKLKIAWVNIGDKDNLSKIVCGGTNLKEHMAVPVALPGAQVRWHGKGDLVKLEKTKIRGEESNGMVCAANEIGLFEMFPHGEMEITNLNGLGLEPGQPLAEALHLDDVVFDIDNKSLTNRPDLWSHYGLARELAAIFGAKLKELAVDSQVKAVKAGSKPDLGLDIEIEDKKLCPRYLGCLVENVKVEGSPEWLKAALAASGYKAINNIVDITNYVMSEVGQPMHAFDARKLQADNNKGIKITVRAAKKNEKIVALDEKEYKLDENNLVISAQNKAVALAGIIGGQESSISGKSQQILLEAANFEALNIRRSEQRLGIRTDSSMRFEKALHPNLAEIAMRRALKLIKEIIPSAQIKGPIVEAYEILKFEQAELIEVSQDFIRQRIGKRLSSHEIKEILESLGFKVNIERGKSADKIFKIKVPWWRATGDVSLAEDIVEEVARIYGYDKLGLQPIETELEVAKYQAEFELENKIKYYLTVGAGMDEVFNYPWAHQAYLDKFSPNPDWVELSYPPADELKFLQNSLVPNLIKNIEDNLRFFDKFKIFELARVYKPKDMLQHGKEKDKLPAQPKFLAGAVVGPKEDKIFLEAKGILEGFFAELKIEDSDFQPLDIKLDFIDGNRSLQIIWRKEKIGWLGELDYNQLNLSIKNELNIRRKNKRVALFELDWDKLMGLYKLSMPEHKYSPLSQFPAIERDLAVELDWTVKWADIKTVVQQVDKLIQQVEFLSEYALADKKSLAFRVRYQAERTLKDKEVNQIEKKIIAKLENKFKAKLRA